MKSGLIIAATIILAGSSGTALASEPLPPGATNVTKSGSVTEFDSAMTPESLDAFYRNALPRDGWSTTDDVHNGPVVSFYFSRGADGQGSVVFRSRGAITHVALKMVD